MYVVLRKFVLVFAIVNHARRSDRLQSVCVVSLSIVGIVVGSNMGPTVVAICLSIFLSMTQRAAVDAVTITLSMPLCVPIVLSMR